MATDKALEGDNEPFEPNKPVSEVRQEPYDLNELFEWSDIKLGDADELHETYTLLYENYVEDDDNMFRFDYSKEFLLWCATPPNAFSGMFHKGATLNSGRKPGLSNHPAGVRSGTSECVSSPARNWLHSSPPYLR